MVRARRLARGQVVSYVAKGIAIAVSGVLFLVAALTHDSETAGGLDSAVRTLAVLPLGPLLLWVVGVGLILYALFCFSRALRQDVIAGRRSRMSRIPCRDVAQLSQVLTGRDAQPEGWATQAVTGRTPGSSFRGGPGSPR